MSKRKIDDILADYNKKKLTIATVCSHSSLQIFNGAKKEGFRTLGISVGEKKKLYDAFPLGKPDDFFIVNNYNDILKYTDELIEKNVIIIPHGSFVEYLGPNNFMKLELPTFGNKAVLDWESDRKKERIWLEGAGLTMPQEIKNPKDINKPVIVKYHGAKGGKGFFVAKTYDEFQKRIEKIKNLQSKSLLWEHVTISTIFIHLFRIMLINLVKDVFNCYLWTGEMKQP